MRGNLIGIACEKRVVGTERAKTLDRDFQGKSFSSLLRRDKDEVEPAAKSAKLPSCEVTGRAAAPQIGKLGRYKEPALTGAEAAG